MNPYSFASARGKPAIPVGVGLDPLDRLAGVVGDPFGHHPLQVDDLLGLDGDVGGLPLSLTGRLVHEDPGVGQGESLALGAGAQQELTHRRRQPHAHGRHVAGHVLHGVVDGQAGGDRSARGVDVQADVPDRVLGGQQKQLGADQVGALVVDLGPEEDDALLQQPLVDVGSLGPARASGP